MESEQINLPENGRKSFDQMPIGQNQAPVPEEYPPDFNPDAIEQNTKPEPLPLAKRIQSKVWKIRKQALQDLLKEVADNWKAYLDFQGQTIKLIVDANQQCQDKALKILLKFLESGNQLNIDPKPVIKCLVQKCLVVEKGDISSTATQILFWIMDNYSQILLNQASESILNKNPKIVASSLSFLENLLHNYGAKKLQQMDRFAKSFKLLADSVRPVAKTQALDFFKECFRWMGESSLGFSMHPEVKDEVLKFAKTYVKEPMVILRGLNEEQKKSKKPVTECMDDDDGTDQPQDVLGFYDARWVDKVLQIKKWKEKKEILDEFIKKTQVNNIVPHENSHYITLIKRLLSENNINLLQCGFKVVKNLCKGLKKNFAHSAKSFCSLAYGKLKDSKAMIVDEAQQTLMAMLNCITFEDFMEDIREGMKDKAAQMRLQTLKFVFQCISKKDKRVCNGLKSLTLAIVDTSQDGSFEVRDQALDILCKLKTTFGMNFFGDKLKKLPGKKLQIIQNHFDPLQNSVEEKFPSPVKVENKKERPQPKSIRIVKQNPKNRMTNKIILPSDQKGKKDLRSEFQNPNESLRLNSYQNLSQKTSQVIYKQLIQAFKNKVPMVRESSAMVLKTIINAVKKCSTTMQVEHLELLLYHDWKKCKCLLTEFIQNSKLSFPALQYVKGMGILPQVSRRNSSLQKSSSLNSADINPLKQFHTAIQVILPKMTSPDFDNRIAAVEEVLQCLTAVPVGAPIESTEINPSASESISQFFNVLRCRIQDSDVEIADKYISVITQMLAKGFFTKYRTAGRQLMSLCIQKVAKMTPSVERFFSEVINCQPTVLWQLLASQLPKNNCCYQALNLIRINIDSFIKNADQKSYILPLLTAISKDLQIQKCGELLDQIVEINGVSSLEKVVKESRLSGSSLQNYLKKWHIHPVKDKSKNAEFISTNTTFIPNKLDRLNEDASNPWPISPSSTLILKLIGGFLHMGEPFASLACPVGLTEKEFSLIESFTPEFIQDYSDLLLKWISWRVHLEFKANSIENVMKLLFRMVQCEFQLQQCQLMILLGTLYACLVIHKKVSISTICQINKVLHSHALYQKKSFKFWVNCFNDSSCPVNQVLHVITQTGNAVLIQEELVNLVRFPAVLKNQQFYSYLQQHFNQKLLRVYGFDPDKSSRSSLKVKLKSVSIEIKMGDQQRKSIIKLFEEFSIVELSQKIADYTEGLQNEKLMEAHLKIIQSIIEPYFYHQISHANVYHYFQELRKSIDKKKVDASAHLLPTIKLLCYFLIDLSEMNLEKSTQFMKCVNKITLLIIESADPKHILQIFFALMRQVLQTKDNSKLNPLLPRCTTKVIIRNEILRNGRANNPCVQECYQYALKESIKLIAEHNLKSQSFMFKGLKNLLETILTKSGSIRLLEEILQASSLPKNLESLLKELIESRAQLVTDSEIFSYSKDPKANASRIKLLETASCHKPLE